MPQQEHQHHIALQGDLEQFLKEQVRSGQFRSENEVIEAALLLLRDHAQEEDLPEDVEELRAELDVAIGQFERGEETHFTAEDIIREGESLLARKNSPQS